MSEGPDGENSNAQLGAFDIGCIVVGGIIGVGIFFTPQQVCARVDDSVQVLAAWGLGGLLAVLGALVFAELARRVPGHGGMFLYIHAAFGRFPAFLYGWSNWLVIQSGALGVIGLVMVTYLDVALFGQTGSGHAAGGREVGLAVVAILGFTGINVLGLRVGKRVQNLLTVLKTAAVFGLVVLALVSAGTGADAVEPVSADPAGATPRVGWVEAMAAAILPVMFSFGGWQQGSFVAGVARRPRVSVPIGIVAGVLVVVIAYLTVNLAFLDLLGFDGARNSTGIGADAARVALEPYGWGDLGSRVLAVMVVLSSLGIMNTICLAPPFVLHAMARQGLFLDAVGHLHPRTGSPVVGVLVQGLWAVVLLVTVCGIWGQDALGFLIDGVVFVDWLFFALCGFSLFLLLHRRGDDEPRPLPMIRVVVVAFTLLALGITWGALRVKQEASVAGFAIVAAGVPFFLLLNRAKRGVRDGDATP